MDLILIVLYKQKASESETLLTLFKCEKKIYNKFLYVWDNSPTSLESSEIDFITKGHENFKYFHCENNKSLSEVYNLVIRNFKFDRIFVFDQDTTLTDHYFELIDKATVGNDDIGLFLPFVKINKKVVSPLSYRLVNFKKSYFVETGKVLAKNKTAFASGLCIREWVFKNGNIWFDQNLNFYGIDYKFVLDYGDFYRHMYVIDYKLKHGLSYVEKEALDVKIKRFDSNIFACFYLANERLNLVKISIVVVRCFLGTFKMSMGYRSFAFFFILIKNIRRVFLRNV